MGNHGHDKQMQHRPSTGALLRKLFQLLAHEKRDLWALTIYSILSGILALVVPLSSQAIINSVQLGVVTTQLVVLCIGVGVGMALLGVFTVLEYYIIDIIQRRLFARAAFDVAARLRHITAEAFFGEYPPEVINRFFDVLTIQKALSKLLLDGLSASLIALVGLILLAIYHPIFLLFDIILFLFVCVVIFVLSSGGVESSIAESKKKYALVNSLEDIARCQTSFKLYATDEFVISRANAITGEYIKARKMHFRVLALQLLGSTMFRAIALMGVLGLGGFLVIEQSLSVGQLVAAEIVIISVLSSVDKLISHFEQVYDLLTAIDKMAHITEKQMENERGETPSNVHSSGGAAAVAFENVEFHYPDGRAVFHGINFSLEAGARASFVGASGSGKTTLTNLLVRLYDPQNGRIMLNGHNIRHLQLHCLRASVGVLVGNIEIFPGTIRENIVMGRSFSSDELDWALQIAQIRDDITRLPNGLETALEGLGGDTVPESLLRCLTVARVVIGRPQVLVINNVLSGLAESLKLKLLDTLYGAPDWTILDISHDPEQIRRADMVFTLRKGVVAESGSLPVLVDVSGDGNESQFSALFPRLTASQTISKENGHAKK